MRASPSSTARRPRQLETHRNNTGTHMRNPRCFVATVAACVALASMLVTASPAPRPQAQQASQGSADPHPAVALMEQMCNRCHDSARILATRRTSLEWEDIINKMIEKGAAGTGQEFETVFAYLLAHHGKILHQRRQRRRDRQGPRTVAQGRRGNRRLPHDQRTVCRRRGRAQGAGHRSQDARRSHRSGRISSDLMQPDPRESTVNQGRSMNRAGSVFRLVDISY